MVTPTFVSLFSGVGGLDLAIEANGFRVIAQVENGPFCQERLADHWLAVPRYGDVKEIDWHGFLAAHGRPDLVAAGFPCQPTSQAGRRKAQADPRWLWPEVARCLRALRPDYVFLENTLGLLSRGFDDVLGELAALGFDAEWDCLQAADVGAPHERDRVFVLAYCPRPGRGRPRLGAVDAGQAGRGDLAELAHAAGLGIALEPRDDPQGFHVAVAGTGGGVVGRDLAAGIPKLGRVDSRRGADVADAAEPGRGQSRGTGEAGGTATPAREPGRLRGALEHPSIVRGEPVGRQQQPQDGDPQRRIHFGEPESRVGGGPHGLPAGLDGHRWPAPPGPYQHPWEPPRTVGKGIPNRGRRIKALGNAVVPQQGALAFALLWRRMLEAAA